jgi:pimeloyl-ACP methyl ester carboxylesterase
MYSSLRSKKNKFIYATAFAAVMTAGVLLSAVSFAQNQQTKASSSTAVKSGYAPVNGLKLYYEIHGKGQPLVLLHGGLGATEMFGANLATLAASRKVIAVDLQGHGRTADIDRPISTETMADDIAELLKYLKIDTADIMGYSMGGGVALRTAIQHPERVRKLVIVSTPFKRNAFYPDILAQQAQMGPQAAEFMKQTPMYEMYARLTPRPDDWGRLITKIGEAMKVDYDWTESVKKIKAPTLIMAADADLFPPSHAVELFGLLGGGKRDGGWDGSGMPASQLAILPGLTHYNIFMSPAVYTTALAFLKD